MEKAAFGKKPTMKVELGVSGDGRKVQPKSQTVERPKLAGPAQDSNPEYLHTLRSKDRTNLETLPKHLWSVLRLQGKVQMVEKARNDDSFELRRQSLLMPAVAHIISL